MGKETCSRHHPDACETLKKLLEKERDCSGQLLLCPIPEDCDIGPVLIEERLRLSEVQPEVVQILDVNTPKTAIDLPWLIR